ncbi:sensor histidine kinase, partial [Actinocorallia lasiicapitis]
AERERIARELHDVAGHHLSAVVVHASAAARIADPELTRESLTHAADTGRRVLDALGRLVDVVGEPTDTEATLESLLPPLAEGLTKLGFPVTITVAGSPAPLRPSQVEAVYRIVQESLTNALRYGHGEVEVEVAYPGDSVVVTVVNPCGSPVAGLGSGRGVPGMRERAHSLGGTLTAGRNGEAWWVEARLPLDRADRAGLSWDRTVDLMTMLLTWALPMLVVFSPDAEDPVITGTAQTVTAGILLALSSVLLWWRRTAPWRTLFALLGVAGLWIAVFAVGGVTGLSLWIWLFAWTPVAVAVAAVALPGRPARP